MLDFFEKLKFRKLMLFAIDAIATACLSILCLLLLKDKISLPLGLLVLFACVYVMRALGGIYRQIVRYSSLGAYMRLVLADFLGGLLYLALAYALLPQEFRITPWLAISLTATGCLLTLCERFLYQYTYRYLAPHHAEKSTDHAETEKIKCAIIGAGTNGYYLADELKASKSSLYIPCCFIDNDKEKIGKKVNDLNVYSPQKATELLRKLDVTHVIVAIPERNAARRQALFDLYSKRGFKVMIYEQPFSEAGANALASYDVNQKPIVRDFKIEDLLFRDPIQINDEKTSAFYRGKTILITGGGGSVGSEICRQLAKFAPKKLIVLDIYENNAYDIQQELKLKYGNELDLEVEIASVREPERADEVMATYRPDIVVHAAAHKHVPLMEHNCAEAIKNNVFGTLHVVNAAEKYGVKKFIMISTDKAVNPTNVMGASKRMCEMIVQSREGSATEFTAVRFGNVLGSNGSVIPLFRRQIANGGPVTITDFRIIRYFMTIPEAAQLVLEAGAMAKNGELYVLDMGKPVRILQLAEDMIRMSGFEPYRDIDIQEIGLREGEKLYEELLVKTEELDKTENDMIFVERDKGLTRDEVAAKLQTLAEAAKNGEPAFVKRAMKQVVDTYHDPDEVNKNAEQTEEMKTAAMAE